MPKSSGGGGSGGRSGGGAGSGPDMTTPVKEMGLDKTISNIYKTRQAITDVQNEMRSDAYLKGGYKETRPVREKLEMLTNRRNELENSVNRSMTGEKGAYRETLSKTVFKNGEKKRETKDLGPWKGSFSAHYGTV